MMSNYYPFITKCAQCGKEFLLELVQDKPFNNVAGIYITCKECLAKKGISSDFARSNPKEAEFFEKWLSGESATQPQATQNISHSDTDEIIDLRNVEPPKKAKTRKKR